MMAMKKNDVIRYCAGGVFLLQGFMKIRYGVYLNAVLLLTIYAIIGVAFFVKKPVLATVGGAAWSLHSAIYLIDMLEWYRYVDGEWMIVRGLLLVTKILFLVLTLTRKKQLGIAAAVICGIVYLGEILFMGFSLSLDMLLYVAGYALAAFAFESTPVQAAAPKPKAVQEEAPAMDKIQRLEKLYSLLEKEIITEEEFDAKKKQLLEM